MISRGVAGVTHCGKIRKLAKQDRLDFDVWVAWVVCTEKPHGAGQAHYNRWSRLQWQQGGQLQRREEPAGAD